MKRWFVSMWALLPFFVVAGELEIAVKEYIADFPAEVGVAVIIDSKDTVTVNSTMAYPLASVVKFPQAVAALGKMEEEGIPLDSLLVIAPADLHANTYSPMRDAFPDATRMTIADLFHYSIALSDNNACDKIFSAVISPMECDRYIRQIGIAGVQVAVTEEDMHADIQSTYSNAATPLAIASLFDRLATGMLLGDDSRTFLLNTLAGCRTGADKLPKPLSGKDCLLCHKTGNAPKNAKGEIIADNDAGLVFLPCGRHYAIAVFVKDSRADSGSNAALIAGISSLVYEFVTAWKP